MCCQHTTGGFQNIQAKFSQGVQDYIIVKSQLNLGGMNDLGSVATTKLLEV